MPTNLVDVDTFSANVQVPVDGDSRNAASVATGMQHLANRTRNLKNRLDAFALARFGQFSLTATSIASGNKFTVTETDDPSTLYTITSNEVQVPAAGWYRVTVDVEVVSSAQGEGFEVQVGGVSQFIVRTVSDTNVSPGSAYAGRSKAIYITTPASQRIAVLTNTSSGSSLSTVSGRPGNLLIEPMP